ncbi:Methyl-accepting chemotaxis protein [Minicystis rosea]|nr:Methyl-accepting chemotaxis protein [Minicystis rosea]
MGDTGKHNAGAWKATKGSRSVFIDGIPAHRVGDTTDHGHGSGQLVEGSPNVFIGDRGGGASKPVAHDRTLVVGAKDALGRSVSGAEAHVTCPHLDDRVIPFSGTTTITGLCSGSAVTVKKALQKGSWDARATNGEMLPATHAHTGEAPAPAASAAGAPAGKPAAPPAAPPKPAPEPAKPAGAPAAAKTTPASTPAGKAAAPPAPAAKPAAAPASAPASASTTAPAAKPAAAPATQPLNHVVHAPAPPATPNDQHQVHIVRPTTPNAQVQLTTVHNWVELVFRAFGYTLPTAATEIAILGVREASLSGKGGVDALEEAAAKGETDKVTFTRETRDKDFSTAKTSEHATTYNDLLFITSTDSTPAHTQSTDVFECTIDAGATESAEGIPVTLEGKLYSGTPGSHIAKRYPGSDIALHLFYEKAGKMALAREASKAYRVFTEIASAKNGATNWKWARIEDNASIHMHFGSESGKVGSWSTGCTVLHHHLFVKNKAGANVEDSKATRYKRFMTLYRGAANKKKIPYLVVSSKYVRSYAEWARYVGEHPDEASKPASVILKDQLVAAPGAPGRYLPSFVTEKFAKDVVALAADKATTKPHADNLKSSLDLVTFTLSL